MKLNKYLIFLFFILINISHILASTITVKQDGSGDFRYIQSAVNEAIDGDTVLVYPGIYYENIILNTYSINLVSLVATTGNIAYRDSTIIDAQQYSSCIAIYAQYNSGLEVTIDGFTLKNGIGYHYNSGPRNGGGIYSLNCSNLSINNCIIEDNRAYSGGGISCVRYDSITLKNNIIKNNYAEYRGGGINLVGDTYVFNEENRNSIFYNHASAGMDMSLLSTTNTFNPVYLDTFTVAVPEQYHIFALNIELSYIYYHAFPEVNILNYKINPVESDLYVSPNGDDNNSGTSWEEPLKTIDYAYSIIKADSLHKRTIYLDEGTYSQSLTGQIFPIQMKPYINLIGAGMDETILDAEGITSHLIHSSDKRDYTIADLTLCNGGGDEDYNLLASIRIYSYSNETPQKSVVLRNVKLLNNLRDATGFDFNGDTPIIANNLQIIDNGTDYIMVYSPKYNSNGGNYFYNLKFINNGRSISNLNGYPDSLPQVYYYNSLFAGNNHITDFPFNASALWAKAIKLNLINCTIANNTVIPQGAALCTTDSEINIINTIMYNNSPYNIWSDYMRNTINVEYSLIDGGQFSIAFYSPNTTLNWGSGNIDGNPLFDSSNEEHPFSLRAQSPCINTGTPDTTGLHLPEFDLAGNPRIYGGRIDKGCYEFQGETDNTESELMPFTGYNIKTFPNPFLLDGSNSKSGKITIEFDTFEDANISVDIFNIKGQKITNLCNCFSVRGRQTLYWNIKDDFGNKISSGQYFIKMRIGKDVVAKKMLILK